MRFGILGTGRITRRLVVDLQSTDGVSVTAIGSRTAARAEWFAGQHGIGAAVQSYQSVLDRDDVDAVYIALPPSLHEEVAIAAAAAGKHVLCEKPLAMDLKSAQRIAAACADGGVRWLDATAWLHHRRTAAFRQWIAAGRFGVPTHVSAAVSFYQPYQTDEHRRDRTLGGGCRLDIGWYAVGAVLLATDALPDWVYASAVWDAADLPHPAEMRVTAMMGFATGMTATISCGYDTASRKWMEIAGNEASLVCDDFTRPWPDKPARCWIHQSSGAVTSESFDDAQERRMIETLIDDQPLDEFHAQALRTHAILDAIQTSFSSGARVELSRP